MSPPAGPTWDEVVVGAGSAGAVLARRLVDRGDRRVLLVEAGAGEEATAAAGTAPILRGRNWDYVAHLGTGPDGRRYPYRVGKGLGGSSAVNAAIALRGLPGDFDRWADLGNPAWEWKAVLPYFRELEADADAGVLGSEGEHGTDGPVPIRRPSPDHLSRAARGFLTACRRLGLPELPDLNDGGDVGVGLVPSNTLRGQRMSVAATHLGPVLGRPNLTVWTRTHVQRVLLDEDRAVGVEVLRNGSVQRVAAGRVTLCGGAVNTPLILQRSGIGDPQRLAEAGVRTRVESRGVGQNLVDHAAVAMWSVPGPRAGAAPDVAHEVMARVATRGREPDVGVFLADGVRTADLPDVGAVLGGGAAMSLSAVLLSPTSRGEVVLTGDRPRIALRLAESVGDVEALVGGVRLAWSLLRSPAMAGSAERTLVWTDRMVQDDVLVRAAVRRFACPLWHPAGTARMGRADDPGAVVDERGRVHGVERLWVVDASVMPTIPSAPTNLTCMVIGERAARWMA
jgi:choline dehydrogenase